MKEIDADIIIVGSGLVGLVAAHGLSALNYNVVIIDKKNLFDQNESYKDTRTVAVSEGSKRFLESLSLWNNLEPYCEPIKTIKVFNRLPKNTISFNNQVKKNNLGYVIENKIFSQILSKKLQKFSNVKMLFGYDLKNIELKEEYAEAILKKIKIKSKLIIAADGKNSDIKKLAGNKTYKKTYSENALVTNFDHKKNLNSTAYEIFYNTGPLAILPMRSSNNYYKSTVIWSNKPNLLKKLKNSNDKFFLSYVEETIGSIVGEITKINSRQIFPLSAHINDSFINKRLIYIGDSAHSIHPIAGQGWNLGVNDVKNLYKVCKKLNVEMGSSLFCKNYNDLSYNKAFQLFQITDRLNSHFKKNSDLLRFFSNIGFKLVENKKIIKNELANYAMGI